MSASPEAARKFFSYPSFAVVGASNDPSKFGNISTSSRPSTPCHPLNQATYARGQF